MSRRKKGPQNRSLVQSPEGGKAMSSPRPARARIWLAGLLLAACVLLAYLPVLKAGFIWDDDDYVTANWTLHNLDGLRHIWFDTTATPQYYPLVHTTYWLEYHFWKLNPMGYHAINVLLHTFAAILLWRVLAMLEVPGAWLAAAIFALHPVNVESVAWVTERKNVLSAVFFFAAAWAYLRFAGKWEGKERRWGWWFLAWLLFVCALLSKTVACSLPAALLLVCWWKKGWLELRDVLPTIPFFIAGLWLGLQTARLEQNHVGAVGPDWSFSFAERCLIAGRALWFYAGKLFWPEQLTFIYPRWHIDTSIWWQWLFPVAALAMVVALWLARKRIGRGPLAAVLFFAATLFPALGFFNAFPMLFSFVADHFQYLAGAGIMALAAAGITAATARFEKGFPFLRPLCCALLLLVLGTLTWRQTRMYADVETLWETTIQRNPQCWMAHNNLGLFLADKGLVDEGIAHFQTALSIRPQYPAAYNNLGTALTDKGQINEAIADFQKALQFNPDYAEAFNNLGAALLRKGQTDEAIASCQKALQIKPGYAEAYNNLGSALLQKGRTDEAMDDFQKALSIKPDYAEAQYNLANAWLQKGQNSRAIVEFQKVLAIQPDHADAHNNLGNLLFQKGELDLAIGQYQSALAIKPNNIEACDNLGMALARKGRTDEAIIYYRKALQINPDDAESLDLLAAALLCKGQLDEALTHLQKALAIQPDYTAAQQNLGRAAWVLATSTDPSVRNGAKAVELARQAGELSGGKDPVILGTLAAAYAEAGNFPEAIATAQRALQLAVSQSNGAVAAALQTELKLYQAGSPFRDTSIPK
jgi:tetratricopeptide (TPR) repeat protein